MVSGPHLNTTCSRYLGRVCCHIRRQQLTHTQQKCITRPDAAFSDVRSADSGLPSTWKPQLLASHDLLQYMKQHDVQASLVHQLNDTASAQTVKAMVLIIKPTAGTANAPNAVLACHFSGPRALMADLPQAGIRGQQQLADDLEAAAAAAAAAVLVLATGDTKVDLSLVAQHLGIPRRRLRLASPDEAAAVTGYQVGGIPAFGHRAPLRTLVDSSIVKQQPQQLLYAGGGDPSCQLQLSVQQLLDATAAEPGVFTPQNKAGEQQPVISAAAASGVDCTSVSSKAAEQKEQQQRQQPGTSWPSKWLSQLPLPWTPGSESVDLVGVIAQKRRLARLLLFCSLVPESVPGLPADGTAAYVRRLWRHPHQHTTAEVQLILGKTLERKLGREAAAALFDHIKVGAVVFVRGKVQQNPAAAQQQQLESDRSNAADGFGRSGNVVLDVVAHEVHVLHKNRDSLARAIRRAQGQGRAGVTSALQLMQVQQQQQQAFIREPTVAAAAAAIDEAVLDRNTEKSVGIGSCSSSSGNAVSRSSSHMTTSVDQVQEPTIKQPLEPMAATVCTAAAAAAAAGALAVSSSVATDHTSEPEAPGARRQQHWQLPLGLGHVHWVSDLEAILQMRQLVLGHEGTSCYDNSNGNTSGSSRSSSSAARGSIVANGNRDGLGSQVPVAVVGIDCEWRPYEKGRPANPVALLQLATRSDVFLVDLLAVCQQQQHAVVAADGDASCRASPMQPSRIAAADVPVHCSPAESALSDFLLCVLSSECVVKVGFGLAADLNRLQQSYPHLLCFQPSAVAAAGIRPTSSQGAAPLARHIDLLQLSRLAAPSIHKSMTSMSLSKLVAAVLGKPLDKTQQTSNWEQRPLSQQQQLYAAIDGHVLTVVFDALLERWLVAGGDVGVLDRLAAANAVKYLPVTQPSVEVEAARGPGLL